MTANAGNEVDAWCTKCRMDLNHRVVAAVAGVPKRVECLTCHTQHNFRPPKGVKEPIPKGTDVPTGKKAGAKAPKATKSTTKSTTKTTRGSRNNRALEWDKRITGQVDSSFTIYSPRATFKVDELLRHSKFGDGFVSDVDPDGKIAVVFRDGEKTLVHGR